MTYSYPAMKKKKAPKKKAHKAKKVASKPKAKMISAPKNKLGVTPLGDKVLVKPITPETTTASGIILTTNKEEKPETGTVVAVGPGRRDESGMVVPVEVLIGDKVMFSKYGFDTVTIKGEEYYLLSESSILAVLEN